jgi:peroxiredoxin
MKTRQLAVLAIVLVLLGVMASQFLQAAGSRVQAMREEACRALGPRELPKQLQGQEAPDFELPDSTGKMWSLKSLRGRPVLLNFWATWCPPCVEEMPTLENLNKRSGDLVVLTVSVDEDWEVIRKFFGAKGTELPILLDAEREVAKRYGTEKFPETFLIDPDGQARHFFWQAKWDSAEALLCLETLRKQEK